MEYEMNSGKIIVQLKSAKIETVVGDAARMDCQRAINYIKSGEAEIDAYVDGTAKPAIDSYVNTTSKAAIDDYVANTAEPAIDAYVTNTAEPAIDSYVTNTAIPQVDSHVSLAKQWAIGDPSEPVGNSAKYWADEAATTVSNTANKDLSNLSATGEAKFTAKQDVISDLATIRSGAALGATAVQPADLATVATTGDYDDLLNKPTIPTVNDATLTITQGGVSKGTFTANASSDVTIALDAGGGGGAVWGGITGDIDDQTDLKDALDAKADVSSLATVATSGDYDDLINKPTIPAAQVNSDWTANTGVAQILNKPTLGTMAAESASDYTKTSGLATVATSGSYNDLLNKPTIPAAQVNSDWDAVSGVAEILNKPSLATVATSGAYSDLTGTPTIPTVNNATLTIQKNGINVQTFTANASTNATANITVPTDTGDLTNGAGYITSSAIANMQTTANLVTSVSSLSTDTQYPSAKLFYDTCGDIETLINAL